MRLKQQLGIFLLLLVPGANLGDQHAATDGCGRPVERQRDDAYHSREWLVPAHGIPSDRQSFCLSTMTGVSAAKLENHGQDFHGKFPGVSSYHVVGYKSANGSNITRVEMGLSPDAVVSVRESANGLALRVTSNLAMATPAAEPVTETPAKAVPAPVAAKAVSGRPVQVRNVSLARGKDGYNVEVLATGPVVPKVMKLTAPDRIVIDIPNSVPAAKREIAVNNKEIKSIRMSRYSLNPPATRVVVDLVNAHEYEVASAGSRLTVKLHNAAMASVPVTTVSQPGAAPQETVEAVPAPAVAQDAVVVAPTVTSHTATPAEIEQMKGVRTPSERAAEAAAHFATPTVDIPTTNANATIKPQPGLNLAMMQAQQPPAVPTQSGSGSCGGNKYNGEPISMNLKEVDLRDFFRLIHDISGLNVCVRSASQRLSDHCARRRSMGPGSADRVEEQPARLRTPG